MIISLLSLIFTLLLTDPQPTNFYPGLTSAREASKKSRKEMIIFFSDKTCNRCESAWIAFTKDDNATNQYISTRLSIDDFDGGIFFDLLDLNEVPSWIILSPDGIEKERWEGGWKDPNSPTSSSSAPRPQMKGYVLQAGYFGSEINAKKMLDDLKAKGFPAFEIKNEDKEGSTFYRIISKVYENESDANVEQQKLTATGIKVSVKKL